MTRPNSLLFSLGMVALFAALVLRAEAQGQPQFTPSNVVPVVVETINAPGLVARTTEPEYWLGLQCQPVTNELRTALKLDAGLGLVIETVVPQSPADLAGLRSGDIVLALGERVARVEQLAQAASKAQAGVIRLQILRDGKVQGVEVKPAPRPAEGQLLIIGDGKRVTTVLGEAGDKVQKQIEIRREAIRVEANKPEGGERYEYRIKVAPPAAPGVPQPGVALPRPVAPPMPRVPGAPAATPGPVWQRAVGPASTLPENMKVTVDKKGSKPATIIVEQGDKMWKTNENEMEMLPAEARAYVGRLLGRHALYSVGAAAHPAAPGGGVLKTFEFNLDEKGQGTPAIIHTRPGANVNPTPGGLKFEFKLDEKGQGKQDVLRVVPRADVKTTPDGKIRVEIREQDGQKPASTPSVHRLELKLPEPAPKNPDRELREIEEKIQSLRREIERLRKSVDD